MENSMKILKSVIPGAPTLKFDPASFKKVSEQLHDEISKILLSDLHDERATHPPKK